MNDLTKLDWKPVREAMAEGRSAYVKLCISLVRVYEQGATQEQMAAETDMSRESVAYALAVGRDQRIVSSTYKLPRSQYALYQLTTLDDEGFKELAKPETTQAKIQEYKRRLAPPPAPAPLVPPKSATTLEKPVERPTVEQVREAFKNQQSVEIKPAYTKDLSWAFAVFGIQGTPKISMESLDAIYRVLTAKRHPDRSGGDTSAMSDLNNARLLIVENSIWVR